MLKSMSDTLRPHLSESRVLDLYAGEGRFGVMAIEEGASLVDFVEIDPHQAKHLKTLVERWGDRAHIKCTDTAKYLSLKHTPYGIIFADPPFEGLTLENLEQLASLVLPHLEPEGIFLVKHPARMIISAGFSGFRAWKNSAVGDAGLTYFVRA